MNFCSKLFWGVQSLLQKYMEVDIYVHKFIRLNVTCTLVAHIVAHHHVPVVYKKGWNMGKSFEVSFVAGV